MSPGESRNSGIIGTPSWSCTIRRAATIKSSDVSNFDQAAAFMGLSLLIFASNRRLSTPSRRVRRHGLIAVSNFIQTRLGHRA